MGKIVKINAIKTQQKLLANSGNVFLRKGQLSSGSVNSSSATKHWNYDDELAWLNTAV